jgi:hypothetical protein
MANLNVSSPANFVSLQISSQAGALNTATNDWIVSTSTTIVVPALQDITVTNNNGTFRWVQLDSTSRAVVATPATNSLNFNIVLDDTSFFTGKGATAGLFDLSNAKTRVYFKFTWGGGSTKYVTGAGYLAGLAPKVTPDQPVWLSPLIIEVDGNYNSF